MATDVRAESGQPVLIALTVPRRWSAIVREPWDDLLGHIAAQASSVT